MLDQYGQSSVTSFVQHDLFLKFLIAQSCTGTDHQQNLLKVMKSFSMWQMPWQDWRRLYTHLRATVHRRRCALLSAIFMLLLKDNFGIRVQIQNAALFSFATVCASYVCLCLKEYDGQNTKQSTALKSTILILSIEGTRQAW